MQPRNNSRNFSLFLSVSNRAKWTSFDANFKMQHLHFRPPKAIYGALWAFPTNLNLSPKERQDSSRLNFQQKFILLWNFRGLFQKCFTASRDIFYVLHTFLLTQTDLQRLIKHWDHFKQWYFWQNNVFSKHKHWLLWGNQGRHMVPDSIPIIVYALKRLTSHFLKHIIMLHQTAWVHPHRKRSKQQGNWSIFDKIPNFLVRADMP